MVLTIQFTVLLLCSIILGTGKWNCIIKQIPVSLDGTSNYNKGHLLSLNFNKVTTIIAKITKY